MGGEEKVDERRVVMDDGDDGDDGEDGEDGKDGEDSGSNRVLERSDEAI